MQLCALSYCNLSPSANMSRPMYSESLAIRPSSHLYQHRSSKPRRSDTADLSLLSTVVLVCTLLVCAVFFITTLAYLLSNEYDVGKSLPAPKSTKPLISLRLIIQRYTPRLMALTLSYGL
ncbi:hypothetical protein BDW22DRAFT_390098 [Trametopsis cervina]|nr:hypothetical protein BDW22DRAFT_390098 [Trametopsis cervina]